MSDVCIPWKLLKVVLYAAGDWAIPFCMYSCVNSKNEIDISFFKMILFSLIL